MMIYDDICWSMMINDDEDDADADDDDDDDDDL